MSIFDVISFEFSLLYIEPGTCFFTKHINFMHTQSYCFQLLEEKQRVYSITHVFPLRVRETCFSTVSVYSYSFTFNDYLLTFQFDLSPHLIMIILNMPAYIRFLLDTFLQIIKNLI